MKKKTKVIIIISSIVILLVIAISVIIAQFNQGLKKINELVINNVDLSTIDDGVYQGKCEYSPIIVEVKVKVQNHQITNIVIIKHENGRGQAAEKITEEVITNQSLNVPYISGATYSSKVILKAIEKALTS